MASHHMALESAHMALAGARNVWCGGSPYWGYMVRGMSHAQVGNGLPGHGYTLHFIDQIS